MKILINSKEHLDDIIQKLGEYKLEQLGIIDDTPVICPPVKEFPISVEVSFIIGTEENNLYSFIYKVLKWLNNIK
jgi:hypothetical protein